MSARGLHRALCAAGVLVLGLSTAACSGSSSSTTSSSPAGTSTAPSSSASSSTTPSASTTSGTRKPTTSAPGQSSDPGQSTAPSSPNTESTVPSIRRTTRPAVAPTKPAEFGSNVSVRLVRTSSYDAKGNGPGETGGPAVAFTLTLTNGSSGSLSVASSNVTADYGTSHTPANPLTGSPYKPWTGTVRAGGSVTGVYCYSIPTNQHSLVTLTISYDPRKQVVIISGPIR